MELSEKELAAILDSTLLDHSATNDSLEKLAFTAIENEFCCICVYPEHLISVYDCISGTNVLTATAVGFPDGSSSTSSKCSQTENSIKLGADEIDMVINLGWLFDKNFKKVLNDIKSVVDTSMNAEMKRDILTKPVIKVIIETSELREEERRLGLGEGDLIIAASEIAAEAGADFIKTSTGMSPLGGVMENDVAIIRSAVKEELRIKAAGGIKTWDHVRKLLAEGVDRIGTSSALKILEDCRLAGQSR